MSNEMKINGRDVPVEQLVPLNERQIDLGKNRGFKKIVSSIKAVGLIEPLCVFRENGHYVILDGFLRFKACQQLGVEMVPCLLYPDKEAYTFNRMVNRLSAVQESRMLRESMKTVSEATIAETFGLRSLTYRLGNEIIKHLHPKVKRAVDETLMSRQAAKELTHVNHQRQLEILKDMRKSGDYSVSFVRALVIKTPAHQRNRDRKHTRPWAQDPEKKQELVGKLEAVQKRYDFYTGLYRQYSADLLKLCIYVRQLITNEKIRDHFKRRHSEILARFESIIFETQGDKPGGNRDAVEDKGAGNAVGGRGAPE